MTKILNLTKFSTLTTSLASQQFIFQKVKLFKEIGKSSYHSLHDINRELRETIQELNQKLNQANWELNGLKNIVLPSQNCDFTELKDETTRLKIRELAPQLQSQKEQIEKLITDSKKRISEESKTVLDFYLTTLKQEEKTNSYSYERNSLKDGKLAAYEDILKKKLTSEDVQQIRQLQERINQDQKHLDSLQKTEKQEAKVQVPPRGW